MSLLLLLLRPHFPPPSTGEPDYWPRTRKPEPVEEPVLRRRDDDEVLMILFGR